MSKKTASVPPEKLEIEALNPRGEIEPKSTLAPAPRVKDLAGKRVGLYSNGKPGMDNFYAALEELLKKRYPTVTTSLMTGSFEITDKDAQAWAPQIDTFVYAVGD
jgi:hypothetical protein